MWGAVAAVLSAPSQPHGKGEAGEGLCWLLQRTAANKLSLQQGRKDLRRIKVHNLKTSLGCILPHNTPYTAIFVYPVGQSVSSQSERIPPKCSFSCACGWQEGQAEAVFYILLWNCCLWLLSSPLEEFVSIKSFCLCVPQSGDCFHRNWRFVTVVAGRGRSQTASRKEEIAQESSKLQPQWGTGSCACKAQLCAVNMHWSSEGRAPEFGVDSGCAVTAGESVSLISRRLPPCTEMCLNLLVWNSTDTHSVALVPSRDKWEW